MSFSEYLDKIKGDFKIAVKVEWLNPDETVNFEFTNSLYDLKAQVDVKYKKGCRRSCTVTINNDRNKFPISFNGIWLRSKFKLYMGIYLDDDTPYYLPQGVFCVSNPDEVYNPNTRTITINGIDKWANLDGKLNGTLTGTHKTAVGTNLLEATRNLLHRSVLNETETTNEKQYQVDSVPPLLSDYFLTKMSDVYVAKDGGGLEKVTKHVYECPYTATVERGKTLADVLLEYANILRADIYYDVNGRLVIEPLIDTADDITDTNKEILWDYTTDEVNLVGVSRTYNFDKVYNDFIVLGNILNGYQFKGRVQNRNPLSDTCVQRIGLKTKEPTEDNQYASDEQCIELATYDAKIYTITQKSVQLTSTPLFHLDVNKLVTLSTPTNNMSKELHLISGFSVSSNNTMTIELVSVNILKGFSVVEAKVYE